jgi:hypothetical protein
MAREKQSFEHDWETLLREKDTALNNMRVEFEQAARLTADNHAQAIQLLQQNVASVCKLWLVLILVLAVLVLVLVLELFVCLFCSS